MASVARNPLHVHSMSGSAHPVLAVLAPISEDLLVDLVFRGRMSSVDSGRLRARRGQASEVPRSTVSLDNSLVDGAGRQSKQVVLRGNVSSIAWQVLFSKAREFFWS